MMKKLIVFDLDPKPPIRAYIGHTDNFHIRLQTNGGGHALADDAISVNSDTSFSDFDHTNFVGFDPLIVTYGNYVEEPSHSTTKRFPNLSSTSRDVIW